MKRKFITILMAICMTVVYMPSIAFAEGFNTDSDRLNNSGVDDWGDDVGDDAMAINYTYVLENAEEGEVLPDEVWATLPEDLNDEGFPKVYTEGDIAIPDEPSQSQVEVNDVTYVFIGWDKQSDTFTDTSVLFTGTWQKVTT